MGMGNNIKHLRAAKGWSHDKLGALAQTSGQTIEMLERRDSTRSKYATAIASAFGITIDLLISANLNSKADAEALLAGEKGARLEAAKPWPFEDIDETKVRALSEKDLVKFEAAILIAAAQAGVDVRKDRKSKTAA